MWLARGSLQDSMGVRYLELSLIRGQKYAPSFQQKVSVTTERTRPDLNFTKATVEIYIAFFVAQILNMA